VYPEESGLLRNLVSAVNRDSMSGKRRDFRNPHNRHITYLRSNPPDLDQLSAHIAGSLLPPVPEHLVQFQEEIRQKKSNIVHFFGVLQDTFEVFGVSPRLKNLLHKAFVRAELEEDRISPQFLNNLMDALDLLKTNYPAGGQDREYLDRLISSIYGFYKLFSK